MYRTVLFAITLTNLSLQASDTPLPTSTEVPAAAAQSPTRSLVDRAKEFLKREVFARNKLVRNTALLILLTAISAYRNRYTSSSKAWPLGRLSKKIWAANENSPTDYRWQVRKPWFGSKQGTAADNYLRDLEQASGCSYKELRDRLEAISFVGEGGFNWEDGHGEGILASVVPFSAYLPFIPKKSVIDRNYRDAYAKDDNIRAALLGLPANYFDELGANGGDLCHPAEEVQVSRYNAGKDPRTWRQDFVDPRGKWFSKKG